MPHGVSSRIIPCREWQLPQDREKISAIKMFITRVRNICKSKGLHQQQARVKSGQNRFKGRICRVLSLQINSNDPNSFRYNNLKIQAWLSAQNITWIVQLIWCKKRETRHKLDRWPIYQWTTTATETPLPSQIWSSIWRSITSLRMKQPIEVLQSYLEWIWHNHSNIQWA